MSFWDVRVYHDNCTDNLATALAELGLTPPKTPSPWNLFMNIPVQADGRLSFEPPVCKAGDYLVLRAEMECIIVFSACPQDIVPINGLACTTDRGAFRDPVTGGAGNTAVVLEPSPSMRAFRGRLFVVTGQGQLLDLPRPRWGRGAG